MFARRGFNYTRENESSWLFAEHKKIDFTRSGTHSVTAHEVCLVPNFVRMSDYRRGLD
jgi:hypothetical protein